MREISRGETVAAINSLVNICIDVHMLVEINEEIQRSLNSKNVLTLSYRLIQHCFGYEWWEEISPYSREIGEKVKTAPN